MEQTLAMPRWFWDPLERGLRVGRRSVPTAVRRAEDWGIL